MEVSGLLKEQVVSRMLEVIDKDILPVTTTSVKEKNKIFGAAILKRSDLSLVVTGTNSDKECPMWHGEVAAIKKFWELPAEVRPLPAECLLLSTHEPCPMCISAMTWSAFPELHYLFCMEDSRDSFDTPYDLRMYREVFSCERATEKNAFWQSYDIVKVVENLPQPHAQAAREKVAQLRTKYASLQNLYNESVKGNPTNHMGTLQQTPAPSSI